MMSILATAMTQPAGETVSAGWSSPEVVMIRLTVAVVVLTVMVVILAAVTAYYAWRTLKATRKSLEVSQESLEFFTIPVVYLSGKTEAHTRTFPPANIRLLPVLHNVSPLPIKIISHEAIRCCILKDGTSDYAEQLTVSTREVVVDEHHEASWPTTIQRMCTIALALTRTSQGEDPSSPFTVVVKIEVDYVYRGRPHTADTLHTVEVSRL